METPDPTAQNQAPLAPPAPAATPPPPPQYTLTPDEKNWAAGAHLSVLIIGFLGPLIVYLMKKETMPFATQEAKECLNFQISIAIYAAVAAVLCVVIIGFLLLPAIMIFALVFTILAGIKASEGTAYRYPLTIRLIN